MLQLRIDGSLREWNLGERTTYSEEEYRRDRDWHIECEGDPGPRHRVFRALYDLLHSLPSPARWAILDQLTVWAGARPVARASHRALTSDETVRLADDDRIDIGAHTVSHPVLATLSAEEQRWEIQESKVRLEALLGTGVATFAYPHGSTTPEAVASVEHAGFVGACSSQPDAVCRGINRFQLPRLGVRNWDGETFSQWLRGGECLSRPDPRGNSSEGFAIRFA